MGFHNPILGSAPNSIVSTVHLSLPFRFLKVFLGSGVKFQQPKAPAVSRFGSQFASSGNGLFIPLQLVADDRN
jgi:hypothetical protein